MKISLFVFILLALFQTLAPMTVFAGPSCLDKSKACDPDLLCSFKSEYYAKLVGFISYAMNDTRGKKPNKGIDGVYYDGSIRQEAIDEAVKNFPDKSKDEQLVEAGQIFQRKIATLIRNSFEEPTCNYGGKLNKPALPVEGYEGMSTLEDCTIHVVYYKEGKDPDNFINNGTTCLEFYQRDLAHEKIHKKRCDLAKSLGTRAKRMKIDNLIAEETDAYQHSTRLSEAYMRFLNLQCSSRLKDPKSINKMMSKINSLLKPYTSKK
jgi:hypothetical protein